MIRFEIVQAVIQNKGDGKIPQPNFIWRQGRTYVTLNNDNLDLTWGIMSEVLQGIRSWGWNIAWIAADFTILHQTEGILGSGTIGIGFGTAANGTATS